MPQLSGSVILIDIIQDIFLYGLLLGNRFISITASMWIVDLAKILNEELRPLGK